MIELLKRIYRRLFLLTQFVQNDLVGRYKTSLLGFLWIILNPIILFFLYVFVFSVVLKVRFPGQDSIFFYGLNLFCGLIAWNAFAESLLRSSGIIMDHSHLIRRSLFPSEILSISVSLSAMIRFIVELCLFILLLIFLGYRITFSHLWLLYIIFLQLLFTVALSWMVAAITVLIRDLVHLVAPIVTVWFFMTPIVYPETMVNSQGGWEILAKLIQINPMSQLISAYRNIILFGHFDFTLNIVILTILLPVLFLLSAAVFNMLRPEFIENL